MKRRKANYKLTRTDHVAVRCSACHSTWVTFLLSNVSDKKIPIEPDGGLLKGDTRYDPKRHRNHFHHCPAQKERAKIRREQAYCLMPECTNKGPRTRPICETHRELIDVAYINALSNAIIEGDKKLIDSWSSHCVVLMEVARDRALRIRMEGPG